MLLFVMGRRTRRLFVYIWSRSSRQPGGAADFLSRFAFTAIIDGRKDNHGYGLIGVVLYISSFSFIYAQEVQQVNELIRGPSTPAEGTQDQAQV